MNTGSATSQTPCPAGTYQSSTAQTSCDDADAGYYSLGTTFFNGAITNLADGQEACATGTWQDQTGQSSCNDADAGYYVDSLASTSQTPCPAGKYQGDSGQAIVTLHNQETILLEQQ